MADTSNEMTQLKYGPQFPAADYHSIRQGGAKNHRVNIGCGGILISTYNVRTLLGEAKLVELEEELSTIKWHIIGLAEVRRHGENLEHLQSGNLLYTRGKENVSQSGVGFLIHKEIAKNVTEFKSTSDRVAMIVLKLNSRYSMKIVQVYMPTSTHPDEEIEEVYEEIEELLDSCKTHYTMVMGDFNATIGLRRDGESHVLGKYGVGHRNERGDRLIEFATSRNLHIANTKFQKKSKWTWKSPDGKTLNEIDFIMTNRIDTVKDVKVLNKVNAGSDHRLIRSKIKFQHNIERSKLTCKARKSINLPRLREMKQIFQLELSNRFQVLSTSEADIERSYQDLAKTIIETAQKVAGPQKKSTADKISDGTRKMLVERREMKRHSTIRDKIRYVELCKNIRKRMRDEIRQYNTKIVEQALLANKGTKAARLKAINGRKLMVAIKDDQGNILTDRERIVQRCAEFYKKLYSSTQDRPTISSTQREPVPHVTCSEIENALKHMTRGKAPGPDGVVIELIQDSGPEVWARLAELFTKCLETSTIPSDWNEGSIVLLHKKGDITDINNYRPISLLSHTGKLFSKIILNRMEATLNYNQAREQAGFRKGYSTMDHLQVLTQLIEKTNEYEVPMCLAFIDYEKAFDSVEHLGIISAIRNHGVNEAYADLLTNTYNNGYAEIRLERVSRKFPIRRGARQGDTISPKLFNAGLEEVFRKLQWDTVGLRVNGENISHLRFADDIALISSDPVELQEMINQLNDESNKLGLKMNMKKTKVMFNKFSREIEVKVNNIKIEKVNQYVYLGQLVTMQNDKSDEIKRRIIAGWTAFNKNRDIMKSKVPMCLKRKVYNQCVLAAMTYGSQTWAITKRMQERLRVTQRSMERAMVGTTRRDRKTNMWLRQQTGVQDIVCKVKKLKWQWAGHIARTTDDRWTKIVTEWIPLQGKRKQGRPSMRWEDDIRKFLGVTWMRQANNRKKWCQHGEAFIQQWI